MESITFEFCRALDDPLDRTLCVRVLFGEACLAQRSIRLARSSSLGEAMLEIDRILIGWARSGVEDGRHMDQILNNTEKALGEPF